MNNCDLKSSWAYMDKGRGWDWKDICMFTCCDITDSFDAVIIFIWSVGGEMYQRMSLPPPPPPWKFTIFLLVHIDSEIVTFKIPQTPLV